jgi:hypothetical protein
VFAARGVPAVTLGTGTHSDFHRPSDTADKINFPGVQQVARFAFRLVQELADRR